MRLQDGRIRREPDLCDRRNGTKPWIHRVSDHPMSAKAIFASSFLARALLRPYYSVIGDGRPMVRKSAAAVNSEFIEWLSSHQSEPFFAFLNYFDAHVPISPPADHKPKFGQGYKAPDLESVRYPTHEGLGQLIDAYDNALTYLDEQLRLLFDALDARGVLDNTLVVVTSDHGEQLGEHGLVNHGNSLYRPLLAVPLLIRFPGRVPSGMRIRAPVSLVDLPSTILRSPARPIRVPPSGVDRSQCIGIALPISNSRDLRFFPKSIPIPLRPPGPRLRKDR